MKWMRLRPFGHKAQTPAFKEHDGNINAPCFSRFGAFAETPEVILLESFQIESWLAIGGLTWPRTPPRLRNAEQRPLISFFEPLGKLPTPEADEVMMVALQKIEVGRKIKCWRRICRANILQISPRM